MCTIDPISRHNDICGRPVVDCVRTGISLHASLQRETDAWRVPTADPIRVAQHFYVDRAKRKKLRSRPNSADRNGSCFARSSASLMNAKSIPRKPATIPVSSTISNRFGLVLRSGVIALSRTWIRAALFASSIFATSYCFASSS